MDHSASRIETRETYIKSIPLGFGSRPLAICLQVAALGSLGRTESSEMIAAWISCNAVSLISLYQELLGVLQVLASAFWWLSKASGS